MLFLLYMGVIAIQNALDDQVFADKAVAVVSLVGVINLPIIKYSVEWWNTLHQPATFKLTEKPAMPAEMWLPLLFSALGLYLFAAGISMWRMQLEILQRERKSKWVKQEVMADGI